MPFTQIFDATSDGSVPSGPTAIGIGAFGLPPAVHIATFMLNGDFDGATVHAVLGAKRSATASSPWTPIADSTIAANSVVGFEVPSGCFMGFVVLNESVSTSLRGFLADSNFGGD